MSAAKRRVKRKIALLVRMYASHHFCQLRWRRDDSERQATASRTLAAMQALGRGRAFAKGTHIPAVCVAMNAARVPRWEVWL